MDNWKWITLTLLVLPLGVRSERVCPSIEIGPSNLTSFDILTKCDVIAGSVTLVKLKIEDYMKIVTPIREITGHLLVYRVEGIQSLAQIFPNLTVIRGKSLLFEKYSLAIYENIDLKEIGLLSLRKIQSGSVRVQNNPILCYVKTVNWMYLIADPARQHLYLKNNRNDNFCPLCNVGLPVDSTHMKSHCWNYTSFQRTCPPECGKNGCNENGQCCSSNCLYGCSKPKGNDCLICKDVRNATGHCLNMCNVRNAIDFQSGSRECILTSECIERGMVMLGITCYAQCPVGYEEVQVKNSRVCRPSCNGNFVIHTAKDAYQIHDCSSINGSLTIELREQSPQTIEGLQKALNNLREITGYLKILNSPQLVSLNILSSLDTISGDELIDNKYSLYVTNNHHLEILWTPNQYVAVLKGRIYFHFNAKLCYFKILKLLPSARAMDNATIEDVSPISNGDNTVCISTKDTGTIRPIFEAINATAVRVKLNLVAADDKRVLLGYLHYYKESALKNVNLYDGFHGCGHDDWKLDISASRNVRHVISNLKPNTQYAYYVRAFAMLDYHMEFESFSNISYFKTFAYKPSAVRNFHAISYNSTEIDLHWWPPKQTNGFIKKYVLNYEAVEEDESEDNSTMIYPSCTCPNSKTVRGAFPKDESYYDKEEIIFDDAFPDLLFSQNTGVKEEIKKSVLEPNTTKTLAEKRNSLMMFLEKADKESIAEQDTGIDDFLIIKPRPACPMADASVAYQMENNCHNAVAYSGIEVSRNVHKYKLYGLKPNVRYNISIRACGDISLTDPCGPAVFVWAHTASEKFEDFVKDRL